LAQGLSFVSPAANIVPPAKETSGSEKTGSTRRNPVALEISVTVSGSRPSGAGGSQDLFSEETKTVLVFEDGAVIGMSAAVVEGQLLFLTNKKTNEEVVCQVLHKRSHKPTTCYVELQFTEEKPDFWGLAFPAAISGEREIKAASHVEAKQLTEDDPANTVAPRSADDADQLKKEAEALRAQLLGMAKKNPPPAADGPPVESKQQSPAAQQQSPSPEAVEPIQPQDQPLVVAKVKLELASVNDLTPEPAAPTAPVEEPPVAAAPTPAQKIETARRVIGMSLPNQMGQNRTTAEAPKQPVIAVSENATDPGADLLPKPELDFSKMPVSAAFLDENDPRSIYKPKRHANPKSRVVAVSALLILALAAGAWYGKLWRYFPQTKKPVAAASLPKKVPASPAASAQSPLAAGAQNLQKTETQAPLAKPADPALMRDAAETNNEKSIALATPAPRLAEAKPPEKTSDAAENKPVVTRKKEARKAAAKKTIVTSAPMDASTPEPLASDAPLIPPILLKAPPPVYPPDAIRNFITGDIKAEVVVDSSGRVEEVKVLSGPQALRAAAIKALKHYQYSPATQANKPVTSKAQATVKFWFNP
jgi:TonB family protein